MTPEFYMWYLCSVLSDAICCGFDWFIRYVVMYDVHKLLVK